MDYPFSYHSFVSVSKNVKIFEQTACLHDDFVLQPLIRFAEYNIVPYGTLLNPSLLSDVTYGTLQTKDDHKL